jgi:hypothetical protein
MTLHARIQEVIAGTSAFGPQIPLKFRTQPRILDERENRIPQNSPASFSDCA